MLTPRRTAMGHRGRKSRSPIKLVTRRQSANVFLIPLTLSQDPLPATYPTNAVLPSPRLSLPAASRPLLPLRLLLFSFLLPPTEFITHGRDRRWYTPLNLQLGTCLPGTLIRAFVREPLVTVKRRRARSAPAIRVDDSPYTRRQSQTSEAAFPSARTSVLKTVDGVVFGQIPETCEIRFRGTSK